MIRPAGGSWRRWALNVTTVLTGAAANVIGSAIDRLRPRYWRCPDCGCVNALHEWCCYRCGAGNPDDA